jgi:hypothetical protein
VCVIELGVTLKGFEKKSFDELVLYKIGFLIVCMVDQIGQETEGWKKTC